MPDPSRRVGRQRLCDAFLEGLELRHWCSRAAYRSTLWPFEALAEHHAAGAFSLVAIHEWALSPVHANERRLTRDLAIVIRFLDWLVAAGRATANPLQTLIERYDIRRWGDLAGALRAADPVAALEGQPRVRRAGSHLGAVILDHVSRMQALGYRYEPDRFLHLDRFIQAQPQLAGAPLSMIGAAYVAAAGSAPEKKNRLSTIRSIAAAMRRHDDSIRVPVRDRRIAQQARASARRPYIMSRGQVVSAMQAAAELKGGRCRLRPKSVRLMIAMGYCCGLRLGELLRLSLRDVDLVDLSIEVLGSKFFKSRRLPLSASAAELLRTYLRDRAAVGAPTHLSAPLLWDEGARKGFGESAATSWILAAFRAAGLKPARGFVGPRFHDLRHTFVAHRLVGWYGDGGPVPVQARLPYLATYLGHKNIKSTLPYITMTPELLDLAGSRYRADGKNLKVLQEDGDEAESLTSPTV